MICPRCQSATRVIYGRQSPRDPVVFERRRECTALACGYRFTTYEGTSTLVAHRVNPKPRQKSQGAPTAEQVEARKVYRLRRMALLEARETERPVEEILAAWNVPPTPHQAKRTAP